MAVTLSLSITQNSQNIANNTSNVTVKVTAKCTYGSYNATGLCTGSITIDGTEYPFSGIKFNTGAATNWSGTVMTKTVDVPHEDDGTKTLACSASLVTRISAGTVKASGSKVLTTIARASQPSLVTWPESTAAVGDFGETFSIHMNRKADGFTHTVRYAYGDRSGTIATGVETGTTWAVPLSFMNDIPAATSASGLIYVDTYNGDTLIGTKYTGFTVTVPASVKPTCTATLEDVNGVDDIYGSPVKGLSKIKVTVSATQAYSSPIASYAISIDGTKYTATPATTGLLKNEGDSVVKVTVTDKRGRTSTAWTYTMHVQGYTPPQISSMAVHRCDADGTTNDQGKYIQVTFSATVDGMGGYNTAAYVLKYKKTSVDTWTTKTFTDLANVYDVTGQTFIFAADESSAYDVTLTVTDRHGSLTKSTSASTAFSLMDFHPSGTAVRFGGVAEKTNTLHNDLDLLQRGNRYAFSTPGVAGSAGYIKMAQLTHIAANADTPITFVFSRRLEATPMTVHVQFRTDSTTVDPELKNITYEGSNYGAFLVKEAESVWALYVEKVSAYDTITLQDWYSTATISARLTVNFPGTLVEGSDPSVLGTYYRATPAKMQSILDFIYPVGSIYWGYSHTSPASLFGGTWTRIENRFLWAGASTATIGGTGGAQTHTLTTDEMPNLNGKLQFRAMTDGTNTASVNDYGNLFSYTQDGGAQWSSALNYTAGKNLKADLIGIDVGGGAAHNNMPPYIQVSAWRRTA